MSSLWRGNFNPDKALADGLRLCRGRGIPCAILERCFPTPEMPANLGKTTFKAYILGMSKRAIRGRKSPLFLQQSDESTS
jgi:hypothetical protein